MISYLKDKIIYVSRPETDSLEILSRSGAEIIFGPAIETSPIRDNPPLEDAARRISEFDYIVFTSAKSVNYFYELTGGRKLDTSKIKIAALGDKTSSACMDLGYRVDLVPENFSAAGLLLMFAGLEVAGKKFLLPCSDMTRDELEEGLLKLKAVVTRIPVYTTGCVPDADAFRAKITTAGRKPDIFIFTSPSSFDCFCRLMNIADAARYFTGSLVAAIGATTGEAIKNNGITEVLIPPVFTLEAIAEQIAVHFAELKL